ncbi:ecdysone-induced protein 74EF-like [Anopheles bellator]|uniref:ecdysone-induced protein 74EF-like n=1 Tax=Anopheles bellator TaxID=139047 RepID=UPI002647EA2D|nr:ecdysone-induced protein 74EF-like [Anopheles bellator]
MPFIDDELLWSPDNDGRMVDLQACLQAESNQTASQTAELANGGCDLNTLEEQLDNDSDELLRQLTENTFELEQFFQDFPATEIKVEENNNDLQLDEESSGQIFLQNCSQFLSSAAAAAQLSALSVNDSNELDGSGLGRLCSNDQLVGSGGLTTHQLQEQLLLAQAQGLLQQNRFNNSLLAEKILQNHHQQQQHLDALGVPSSNNHHNSSNHASSSTSSSSNGGRAGKPPDIVIKGGTFAFI